MIGIINYGIGNIRSIRTVYEKLGIDSQLVSNSEDLKKVSKIILPGVGSFDYAMTLLNKSGMRDELETQVITNKKPVLGICVGMQMMANRSDEGLSKGLGWIDGEVKSFIVNNNSKLPHMGWNNVQEIQNSLLFKNLDSNSRFYFLHSFYFCSNQREFEIGKTYFQHDYTSVVNKDNIYGGQFHPEKSHQWGVELLNNFYKLS